MCFEIASKLLHRFKDRRHVCFSRIDINICNENYFYHWRVTQVKESIPKSINSSQSSVENAKKLVIQFEFQNRF